MWNIELEKIYENNILNEELYALRTEYPKVTKGTIAPKTAGPGLSYKDNNKVGMIVPNAGDSSLAGLNIPFGNPKIGEQQEEELNKIFKIISDVESEFKDNSPTHNAARFAIGKIKEKLEKIK